MVEVAEQQQLTASVSTDFSWATDYSKVKYGVTKFYQFPKDLNITIQNLIQPILAIECKHEVCVSAFNDKQMNDKEFLIFMIPTLQTIRDVSKELREFDKTVLSVEHKEILNQLAVRANLIIKVLKAYEIDKAEKTINS